MPTDPPCVPDKPAHNFLMNADASHGKCQEPGCGFEKEFPMATFGGSSRNESRVTTPESHPIHHVGRVEAPPAVIPMRLYRDMAFNERKAWRAQNAETLQMELSLIGGNAVALKYGIPPGSMALFHHQIERVQRGRVLRAESQPRPDMSGLSAPKPELRPVPTTPAIAALEKMKEKLEADLAAVNCTLTLLREDVHA